MNKRVEFTDAAASWLFDKVFVTEDVIINVIQDFPIDKRIPLPEKDCFQIPFRRRKKSVIIWVHEYPDRFLVYKLHHF